MEEITPILHKFFLKNNKKWYLPIKFYETKQAMTEEFGKDIRKE